MKLLFLFTVKIQKNLKKKSGRLINTEHQVFRSYMSQNAIYNIVSFFISDLLSYLLCIWYHRLIGYIITVNEL
jgi:hypothetical protein